jgi:hypothetical protein
MSSPAAAGPTTRVIWNAADCTDSAAARSAGGTRLRSDARRAAQSTPWNAAASAVQANIGHSSGCGSIELTASPVTPTASSNWVAIITLRRSHASTSGPPSSEPASSGRSCPRLTRPTIAVDPVSW